MCAPDGPVQCWGQNEWRQAGDPAAELHTAPNKLVLRQRREVGAVEQDRDSDRGQGHHRRRAARRQRRAPRPRLGHVLGSRSAAKEGRGHRRCDARNRPRSAWRPRRAGATITAASASRRTVTMLTNIRHGADVRRWMRADLSMWCHGACDDPALKKLAFQGGSLRDPRGHDGGMRRHGPVHALRTALVRTEAGTRRRERVLSTRRWPTWARGVVERSDSARRHSCPTTA